MDKEIIKKKPYPVMQLTAELQDLYISFVQERVGIRIKRDHAELIKAISAGCDEHSCSPEDYLKILRSQNDNSDMIAKMVSAITIGETYFFRDKRQIKLLNEVVLPGIIDRKLKSREKKLRIWSAGCSSGEEIYTVVMMLKDLLPDFNEWRCEFLATDINIDVLKKGISGKYGEWSMRAIPEKYLARYFTKTNSIYEIDDDIKNRVKFEYVNLNSDTYPSLMNGTSMQDLVLCRNVLIYFDNDHIKKILDNLSNCIIDEGYILLGASDPVAMINTGISSVHGYPSLFMKKSKLMVSVPSAVEASVPVNITEKKNNEVLKLRPDIRILHKSTANDRCMGLVNKKNESVNTDISVLLKSEKWSEVIMKVDQYALTNKLNSMQYVAKATALANIGNTDEAIKTCEESFNIDKMNKNTYFIYALTLAEVKRMKDAEAAYRKALYIDPDFLVCRYQFGLFLIHMDRQQEGMKALESAIISASQFEEGAIVPDSNNMSYKELISVLKNAMALYQ